MYYLWLGVLFFASLGVKLLLAVAAIYMLLPRDRHCMVCDNETLPLLSAAGWRRLARWCRIQRRWCPACGETQLARYQPEPPIRVLEPSEELPPNRPVGRP